MNLLDSPVHRPCLAGPAESIAIEIGTWKGAERPMTRILLIEDNEMNRDMLTRRLERKGYEVATAVDGLEGIAAAESGSFDLVLMDMSLPELDGWEATRRLRANPRTHNLPIIALTAHAMPGDRERAIEAGCDDYDSKPVEFPRLVEKIEGLLNARAPS